MTGPSDKELTFTFKDADGHAPNISLGEKFSYLIDAHGSKLTVNIYADGHIYNSTTTINSIWQSDALYFKAGVYLGNNAGQGWSGAGQASFYGLDSSHIPGGGLGGVDHFTPIPDPAPEPSADITGTSGNDTLDADRDTDSTIHGKGGSDNISGHDGNDILYGDDGNDIINGYWGNDMIYGGTGNDMLYGGQGNDTLDGGTGKDKAAGGGGHDTFIMQSGETALTITDFSIDTQNSDKLILKGFSPAELQTAHLVQSGTSALLHFDNGTQVTFNNLAVAGLTSANLLADVDGKLAGVMSPGSAPVDQIPPSESLKITGTAGNDTLNADHDKDTLVLGGAGKDYISGHDGNDNIHGQDGDDIIYGYWGKDSIHGGTGADKLSGGQGADVFIFENNAVGKGSDTISDFLVAQGDRIDISDVLHGRYDPVMDALADFVKIENSGKNSIVSVDCDGRETAWGWTRITTITGVTGLTDEQQLALHGTLIVS